MMNKSRQIILLRRERKKYDGYLLINIQLLVLDLDETLVFSTVKISYIADFHFYLAENDNEGKKYYVYIRSGCTTFLEEMSKHYDLCVYTAS